MPIIIKPVEILKNQDNIFQLDKDALAAESKVSSDAYFSDQLNWKRVIIAYLTDIGNQVEFLTFNTSLETPIASFRVSDKARDVWQVDAIIIQDFDGGYLRFERSELTTAEFDVDFGEVAPPPLVGYFSNDFSVGLATYEQVSDAVVSGGALSFIADPSGNMIYEFSVHDDLSSIAGFIESNPSKSLIVVDDLVSGITLSFDVVAFDDAGAGSLPVKITVYDDLFSTATASSPILSYFITSTGNYTMTVAKNTMQLNSVTSISKIKLEIEGGISGFSTIQIDNLVITADQTSGDILEQNVVAGAIRDAGADLALDGQSYTQTFSHNTNFSIEQVQLHMDVFADQGSTSRTATIEARILGTDGFTILGSKQKTIDVVVGNTGPSWQIFKFDSPITGLLSNETYTIELVTILGFTGDSFFTSRLEVTYNNFDIYPNGEFRVSGPPKGDCAFRVIGTEV